LTALIPTDAIPTKIHIDRHIIMLYIHIHQGVKTSVRFCT